MSFLLYLNRKDFRTACGKLGLLSNTFFKTPLVGLTTTATKLTQIKESLGLIKPRVVEKNRGITSHLQPKKCHCYLRDHPEIHLRFSLTVWFKKISYPPHGRLIIIGYSEGGESKCLKPTIGENRNWKLEILEGC